MIREVERKTAPGLLVLPLLLVLMALGIYLLIVTIEMESVVGIILTSVALAGVSIAMAGLFVVNPNEAKVLQLFGKYVGTVRQPGLRWANPFYTKVKVSTRVRNFETSKLKVNDSDSNPIEIAAVVVWRVVDTAEALFEVDDYAQYVQVQSEAALRGLATNYPYDAHESGQLSLSANAVEISEKLTQEIQERLAKAGVEVIESRISHLAYAPEIASAMLQRQQASAIIAARHKIVEGAVSMVEMALEDLAKRSIVDLDEERKAQMVSNLLVVLCANRTPSRSSTPVRCTDDLRGSPLAKKKSFLLRIDPKLHSALEKWAADELRSLNAQIEFLLRQALIKAGRLKSQEQEDEPEE